MVSVDGEFGRGDATHSGTLAGSQLDGEVFDVVVVGAGFSGIYQLYRLREQGFRVRLLEAGSGPGGVWQQNHYPGARVDSGVPDYEFSIEAVWRDWVWTERFPGADELRRYFRHVVEVLDLARDIRFDTKVLSATFDQDRDVWTIETGAPATLQARFFVLCTGFASKPYIPDIAGLGDFLGECHHTARWPVTGVGLAGKRVGVLGTGASGVQMVQEAAKDAAHLTVFQRSPVTALPMQQRRLIAQEQVDAKPNYREMFRIRNAPPGSSHDIRTIDASALEVSTLERDAIYQTLWERGGFHFWGGSFRDVLVDEAANRTAYNFWRDKTRARVHDQRLAELLAPTEPPYPFGTKRPSLEQDYYEVFNQDNVSLVDLRSEPILSVTPTGIQTSAQHYDLDVLVLATGFDANTGGLTAIDLRDTDGRSLADRWSAGVDTYLGMAVAGYPNLLFLYGPQSPTAFCTGPVCAELQGDWVTEFLSYLRDHGWTRLEASDGSAQAWSRHVDEVASMTLLPRAESWYMAANIPGKRRQLLNYPLSDAYLERLHAVAENGYEGFVLRSNT